MSVRASSPSRNGHASPALAVHGLSKAFGRTKALADVSLRVGEGEIHALLGGNGSGKSTLIKILAGVEHADAGELEIGARRLSARSMGPTRSREAGLHFVHQHESTFPDLTVAENLAAGRGFESDRLGRVRWRAVRARVEGVLERFGIDARPDTLVGALRPATQRMVAIARALQDQEGAHSGVLVLDEPTASLAKAEVSLLIDALRRYAAAGQTILYVTHRLDEVDQMADSVTVLRDGRRIATRPAKGLSHDALVDLIVGGAVEQVQAGAGGRRNGRPVLSAESLSGDRLKRADLSLYAGEVVGLAGLMGSGRSSLLQTLFGLVPFEGGRVSLRGAQVHFRSPGEAMAAGVAYVPEDRLAGALFPDLSVKENLTAADLGSVAPRGRLRHRTERALARRRVQTYGIKTASVQASIASLSGGNQQKVVLARWLERRPSVLLLDEPTQGVDVGARAQIHGLVRRAVDAGAAALVVSSDFEELAEVCDRVLVLVDGQITNQVEGAELSAERLNNLSYRNARVQ